MTDKKCPRCGSQNFSISDYWVTCYLYEVENGTVNAEGSDGDTGKHIKTECICKECNHRWHPHNFDFSIDN